MLLKVKIIEARNIPNLDIIGKSDPYCMLQMSNSQQVYKTKYINNTSCPVWNEEFKFPVTRQASDVLVVVVKDKDTISADDPIGKYQFSLASLTINQEKDEWVTLQSMCKYSNAGSLHVSLLLTKTG